MAANYYQTLGLNNDANAVEIKRAYRSLAKKFHPDYNPGNKNAEEKFLEITLAYETLSSPSLKNSYDRNAFGNYATNAAATNLNFYLHVTSDVHSVKCCEEFELCFTYAGEGRYLKKPDLSNFALTSRPYVDFRNVTLHGVVIKETSITYTICAIMAGQFKIGQASIKINNKMYASLPFTINVIQAQCFFSKKLLPSDGVPYRYKMFYKKETGTERNRFLQNTLHTVLIPRSHKATVMHNIGVWLKIIFTLWGSILGAQTGFGFYLGLLAGSMYGAFTAYLLYFISGIKPKFYFTNNYPVVQEYFSKGYRQGDETGSNNKVIRGFAFLARMLY